MTPFRKLLSYFAPYKGKIALGIACVFLTNAMKLNVPRILRQAIDSFAVGVTQEKLLYYAGLVIFVTVVQGIFLFSQRRILINMSRDIEYDLRNDFYAHLQKL